MSSGVLGLSLVHWSIYSTVFDLPSVLSRLVGLGYSVGRAQFVGGDVVVEYLIDEAMNNVIAKRRLENDNIRVLYDGGRRAIGVMGGSRDSLTVGLAELYRALSESKVPEPQVTELLVSYTDRLTVCPDRSIEFGNLKLQQRGLTLMWGEPQGKSLYIVITPVSSDRSLVMIGARGEWGFTIDVLRQIGDLMVSIRKLDCPQAQGHPRST
jgi:hypothetical protein